MRWASAALRAIRASVNTCLPASSAAQVISQCRFGQVPMQTASTSPIRDQVLPARITCGKFPARCGAGRRFGRAVDDADELDVRQRCESRERAVRACFARADDPNPHALFGHRGPRGVSCPEVPRL